MRYQLGFGKHPDEAGLDLDEIPTGAILGYDHRGNTRRFQAANNRWIKTQCRQNAAEKKKTKMQSV
jgi:hypothetical protein